MTQERRKLLRVIFYRWTAYAVELDMSDGAIDAFRWVLFNELSNERQRRFAEDLHRRADLSESKNDDMHKVYRAMGWILDLAIEMDVTN
jgi:hypothetical protein